MPPTEVLFEYHGYRSVICTHRSKICQEVERHFETSGADHNPRVVTVSSPLQPDDSNHDTSSSKVYFLQRWNPKWGSFVNVESVDDIKSEDRLSVVKVLSDSEAVSRV